MVSQCSRESWQVDLPHCPDVCHGMLVRSGESWVIMLSSSPSTVMASGIPPGHEFSSVSANIRITFPLGLQDRCTFFPLIQKEISVFLGRMGKMTPVDS